MAKVIIQGISYDTTRLSIVFYGETFHLDLDSVQELITLSSKEGKIIIRPRVANSIIIESDYYGA